MSVCKWILKHIIIYAFGMHFRGTLFSTAASRKWMIEAQSSSEGGVWLDAPTRIPRIVKNQWQGIKLVRYTRQRTFWNNSTYTHKTIMEKIQSKNNSEHERKQSNLWIMQIVGFGTRIKRVRRVGDGKGRKCRMRKRCNEMRIIVGSKSGQVLHAIFCQKNSASFGCWFHFYVGKG